MSDYRDNIFGRDYANAYEQEIAQNERREQRAWEKSARVESSGESELSKDSLPSAELSTRLCGRAIGEWLRLENELKLRDINSAPTVDALVKYARKPLLDDIDRMRYALRCLLSKAEDMNTGSEDRAGFYAAQEQARSALRASEGA